MSSTDSLKLSMRAMRRHTGSWRTCRVGVQAEHRGKLVRITHPTVTAHTRLALPETASSSRGIQGAGTRQGRPGACRLGAHTLAALQQAQREVGYEARLLALQHVQGRHAVHVHLNLLVHLVPLCSSASSHTCAWRIM